MLEIEDHICCGGNGIYGTPGGRFRGRRQMGRTLFLKLVNVFTGGQLEIRSSVDYIVNTKVNENFITVKVIIENMM